MRALVVVLLLLSSGTAMASGSVSGAGGADAYTRGKAIFARKLACETCVMPEGPKTPEDAASLVKRVKAGEFGLDKGEQEAVVTFLERRYKAS